MPSMDQRRLAKKKPRRARKLKGAAKLQAIAQRNAEYEDEDSSSESEEWYSGCEHDPRAYQKGGYLKVEPGQKLNSRYKIQKRLGWGHFSMVYLAKDLTNEHLVALKIQKSSADYQEAAEEEIPFLEKARDCMKESELPGANRVAQMIDSFTAFGPHGKHYVIVFEVLGMCSADLVEDFRDGLPALIVKRIMKDILQGLSFLHDECGVVHMDVKPENVLFDATKLPTAEEIELAQKLYKQKAERKALKFAERQLEKDGEKLKKKQRKQLRQKIEKLKKKVEAQEELEEPDVVARSEDFVTAFIGALDPAGNKPEEAPSGGQACQETDPAEPHNLDTPHANLCDLGTACWKGELNKFEVGTRYGRPPEMLVGGANGPPADVWAAACLCLEYLRGDPFFDPDNEDEEGNPIDVDEEHLRLMTEYLGRKWPKSILENPSSGDYFDRKARLRKAEDVDCPGFKVVLSEMLGWDDEDLEPLVNFLLPMLHRDPAQRASAATMLANPWLEITEKDVELAKEWLEEALEEPESSSEGEERTGDEEEEEGGESEDGSEGSPEVDESRI